MKATTPKKDLRPLPSFLDGKARPAAWMKLEGRWRKHLPRLIREFKLMREEWERR